MPTMQQDPQLSDLLTADDIEVRRAGFGYETGTAVVWKQEEWPGGGNPSAVRHGIALHAYLDGEDHNRLRVEGAADIDDPQAQDALGRLRLGMIATHALRYLKPAQQDIETIGDPEELISKDPVLRGYFHQRVKEGRHSPQDLALVAEVDAKTAQLNKARRRYAVLLWRFVAHLHGQGAAARDIASWTSLPTSMIERRISSVSTAGAAAILGIEAKTWSGYVARGQAPAPDDHIGREPVWHLSTVLGHITARPGRPGRPPKNS
ncbi:hypothetical protein ACFQ6U_32435 [Streptomyces sp. NPDC056465]|uniref:hypothetical protein n=1 Tax=Streptomyces sp. NPDC056465 TaxID=3345829 RepID=UPI0036A5A235